MKHRLALETSPYTLTHPVRFIGYVPRWIKFCADDIVRLLGLDEYSIEVRYTDVKGANRILAKKNLGFVDSSYLATVITSETYLTATILILKPLKRSMLGYQTLVHEFTHIYYKFRTFSRVHNEVTLRFIDDEQHEKTATQLLEIEERACEHLCKILQRLGIFDRLMKTGRIYE